MGDHVSVEMYSIFNNKVYISIHTQRYYLFINQLNAITIQRMAGNILILPKKYDFSIPNHQTYG